MTATCTCPEIGHLADTCIHRGPKIREDIANLCGKRGEQTHVHQCQLHGECAAHRYCERQTVRVCAYCSDHSKEKPLRHIYRSFQEQARDARLWAASLPEDIIGFCGVHRSGIAIAVAMATITNRHYVDFEALRQNSPTWLAPIRRKFGQAVSTEGRILVVDDTCMSGGTMRESIKPALAGCKYPLAYGALYFGAIGRSEIDYGFQEHGHIRQSFESNLFHDGHAHSQSFDMDGVFCGDCPSNEIDLDESRYLDWLTHVKPLVIPTRPVGQIVTGRLEKYRPQTEEWLKRHGIGFNRLVMYQAESNADRNSKGDVAAYKAKAYASQSGSTLFVESDEAQARDIARLSGKSTLCWLTQRTFNCD